RFAGMKRAEYDALVAWRPQLFAELLSDRFALAHVQNLSNTTKIDAVVAVSGPGSIDQVYVSASLRVREMGTFRADAPGSLYDIVLTLPQRKDYAISPHAVYAKASWDNFGLLHATDLHISRRNEEMRARLRAVAQTEAAAN